MTTPFKRWMKEARRFALMGNVPAMRRAALQLQAALEGLMPLARPAQHAAPSTATPATAPRKSAKPADVRAGAGEFIAGSFTDAGGDAGTREYKLYIPPNAAGRVLPLVVMLHGCRQDPDDFAAGTRMNDLARERGFYVLYPGQCRLVNPLKCWQWFSEDNQQRDGGEPALLANMTREIVSRYGLDRRRVYVAGLSAGGAMAAILGDAYPDIYAAVGVHSGLPTGSASDARSALRAMKLGAVAQTREDLPLPTIVFHGDEDTTVSPVNGEQLVAASADAAAAEAVHKGNASERPYTRRIFRDARGRIVAEHWTVHGAGHAWSGGSAKGSYTDADGPDATGLMVRFFLDRQSRDYARAQAAFDEAPEADDTATPHGALASWPWPMRGGPQESRALR